MSVLVLIVILCCVVLAAWSWVRPRYPSPPKVPGALPIIGHSHKFFGDRRYLWDFFRGLCLYSLEKGGTVEFWLGPHSFYVLTDPEDSLVVSNECLTKQYFYDFAKEFLNNGLVTAEASIWKTHRKLLNPAFNQQVLNTFINEINVQAKNLASTLGCKVGKDPFDVRPHFINFSLSTVSRTTLGLNPQDQCLIDEDYADAVEGLFALYCDRGQKVWLHLSYLFNWSSLKRKQDKLSNIAKRITNSVIQKRKSKLKGIQDPGIYDPSQGKFKPILDQMLQMADEKDAFTDDNIREHLDTLVAASYDTTSSAMTFLLLVIGAHQDVQERIFSELQEVLKDKDEDLTKDDLLKLVYLEAVIKETMRLYPPAPIIARKIDKDVKLKNYTLPAGNTCFLAVYGINRHPMWGPDAGQFRPERWLDPATLPDNPNSFAVFGIGRRNCIGKTYGMMVMKTALAHILRRYHVTGNIDNVVYEFDVILKPVAGHHIALTLRE